MKRFISNIHQIMNVEVKTFSEKLNASNPRDICIQNWNEKGFPFFEEVGILQ